jgi:hypothetical protein
MRKTRSYQNLLDYTQRRNNDDPHNKAILQNKESIRDALLNLAQIKDWVHLEDQVSIMTRTPVTVGTIGISVGSTVLAGSGTFFGGVGAMRVVQKSLLTNADYYYFIDGNGVITAVWFDITGADSVPAAVTALVATGAVGSAAVEVDISAITTNAAVMNAIATAMNNADVGLTFGNSNSYLNLAGAGTIAVESTTGGASGGWSFFEVVSDPDAFVVQPTGGIDPDWSIELNGESINYDLYRVDGSQSVVLEQAYAGAADLSADSYVAFLRFYSLPADFRQLTTIVEPQHRTRMKRLSRAQVLEEGHSNSGGGRPQCYSIETKHIDAGAQLQASQASIMQLWLYPYPDATYQYQLLYQRWPRIPGLDADVSADEEIVDWPDEQMGVLEAAIEVEVARRNDDDAALARAEAALSRKLGNTVQGDVSDIDDVHVGLERGGRKRLRNPIDVNVDM